MNRRPAALSVSKNRFHRLFSHGVQAMGLALALVGCGGGGGVDSGGTGVTASYASGPITGFGSVIVNGVRYDDTVATVTDGDGTPRSRNDLRLGMTTEVRGTAITLDDAGASVATASSIVFSSELQGTVDSVDATANRLVVLGQGVDVSPATVLDGLSGGLSTLSVGDGVEIYGFFDVTTARYRATRIERKTGVPDFKLRGAVSNLDSVAKAFNIGTQRISYAAVAGDVPATLANGDFVRLRLQSAQIGGVWIVSGVSDGTRQPDDGAEVKLEGLINAFTSPSRFSVNGVAIDASRITVPAGLALGVRVEVEGRASGATLVANEVEIETEDDANNLEFEIRDRIASVDAATLSFTIRGVAVVYSITAPATDFRNGSAADLQAGVNVEVRGMLSADGTRLVAARIVFR